MEPSADRVPVEGSERAAFAGAREVGPADPNERIRVSVYVRPGRPLDPVEGAGATGRHLSREEFAQTFGADPDELAEVQRFAVDHRLTVDDVDRARRVVVLSGPVGAMQEAFGVTLARYEYENGSYRGREGAISVPASLGDIVVGVLGLDSRPAAQPHVRIAPDAVEPRADGGPYSPVEVAIAYDFPDDGDGTGQCVAIIELGGGYQDNDLQTFFRNNGISEPTIVSVGVESATNSPGAAADVEVALDIEVVGAVAPGARIAVYFAPNTDQGFLDAITTAAHDAVNAPSVMSISWGSAESNWSGQSMTAFDQAFHAAALMGVTVCCASGDSGSGDGVAGGLAHADFPASSPNVLGCGGTTLSSSAGAITNEVVWMNAIGATGGGISDVFDVPSYQSAAGVPPSANPGNPPRVGRGVPDVAGDADPETGYNIVVGGNTRTIGGTSAVAPLWSGLVARINSAKKAPSGFINAALYASPTAARDISTGTNGDYTAGQGWDPCTGLGSPEGKLVEQALWPAATRGRAPDVAPVLALLLT
jgi:kumamolisin